MKNFAVRVSVSLCVVACAAAGAALWATQQVLTEDHNGDGRPDVWRHYDTSGRLVEVDVDSNFDGRPDVQEYYDRGSLVRRESDRNFNGQADFIEEFDTATHDRIRSVIDIDYDGTADLLVLFRDGTPVFSKRASLTRTDRMPAPAPAVDRDGVARLARMTDPFEADTVVRAERPRDGDACSGLSPPGPCASAPVVARASSTAGLIDVDPQLLPLIHSLRTSPRAPPVLS